MIARFARDAEPRTGHQREDDGEVAQADDRLGYENGAEGATIHDTERAGMRARMPLVRMTARMRWLWRSGATGCSPWMTVSRPCNDTTSDALGLAALPAAAWNIAPAGRGG